MKICKVELQYFDYIEKDGEYIREARQVKSLPCVLTNYALDYGEKHGLIESSMLDCLFDVLQAVSDVKDITKVRPDEAATIGRALDINKIVRIIYIGCIGANPDIDLTYDEFLRGYQYDAAKSTEIYSELMAGLYDTEANQFAQAFVNLTGYTPTKKK